MEGMERDRRREVELEGGRRIEVEELGGGRRREVEELV